MSRRKVQYCFICGKIDQEYCVSLFEVPLDKVDEWQKLIAKPGFKKRSLLCESHFDEKDIDRGFQLGDEFKLAKRRRLASKDVVPTKNLTGISSQIFIRSI